jgi:hypothetical protein
MSAIQRFADPTRTSPEVREVPIGDKMRRDEKMRLIRSRRRHEPEASEGRRYQATVRLVG